MLVVELYQGFGDRVFVCVVAGVYRYVAFSIIEASGGFIFGRPAMKDFYECFIGAFHIRGFEVIGFYYVLSMSCGIWSVCIFSPLM